MCSSDLVGSSVDGGGPKTVEEMTVGKNLNAVQIALAASPRRRAVGFDDSSNIPIFHGFGKGPVGGLPNRRGRNYRQPIPCIIRSPPAEMRELTHRGCAMCMDASREFPKMWHDLISTCIKIAVGGGRVRGH